MSTTIRILDVTIHSREVEIPDLCPSCGAPLIIPPTNIADLQTFRTSTLYTGMGYGYVDSTDPIAINWDDVEYPTQEGFLSLECMNCDDAVEDEANRWKVEGTWEEC